tara:strand:+ start:622 stop:975 length:354 start_codon:yes stop_codon:yes gene_type:complete
MDFDFIKQFHKIGTNENLKRKKEIQEAYNNEKKKNKNYEENLKQTLFKNNCNWTITKNKFPYHFIDNTEHYLVWFKGDINYNLIDFCFRDDEIVYFENKPNCKSILSINHVHVFKRI